MTPIADMVEQMLAAGLDQSMILLAVRTAEECMRASIPQNSAETAEQRRKRKDRERKAANKSIPQNSTEFHGNSETPLSLKTEDRKEKKERRRATRLSAEFQPTPEMVSYSEDLGMTKPEIEELGLSMREWSISSPKGEKLDWYAAWQTWCRRFVKENPRPRSQASPGKIGFPVKPESDQWRAWLVAASPFQKSLMQRAQDTGQPFVAPTEWPANSGTVAA